MKTQPTPTPPGHHPTEPAEPSSAAEVPEFAVVVQHAETTALDAASRHIPRAASGFASTDHAQLLTHDETFLEWMIHDGRATRDTAGRVYLDTSYHRQLPDIDGDDQLLAVYLRVFAAALTQAGFTAQIVKWRSRIS